MIARVIVDNKSKQVDKPFDYRIPDELADKIEVGSRVLVPFSSGNKEVEGFCVGLSNESKTKKLKAIIRLANDVRAFDEEMLALIECMHTKYLASYLDIIHTIVPTGTLTKSCEWIILENPTTERSEIRRRIIEILSDNGGGMEYKALKEMFKTSIQNQVRAMINAGTLKKEYRQTVDVKDKKIKCVSLNCEREKAEEAARELSKKAPVQSRMLSMLCENDFVALVDLIKITDGSHSAFKALVEKGYATSCDMTVERDPYWNRTFEKTEKLNHTPEQARAINEITNSIRKENGVTYLLHGVTGSGKTEVFMQSIENAISMGKTAVMLVPEISLTPQMVARFMSRFGRRVAIFHSGLSNGEKYDQWKKIREGNADIVIGARSAIFTPLKNIGVIILDEEHSDTYKSDMSPRYRASEVAEFRAKQNGATVVAASATPSVESYYKAQNGEYILLEMTARCNQNKMPEITVVDMRKELENGNKSMISEKLYEELDANIKRGEQTILLLNKRGFSTFVSCRSCGYVPHCPNCNISLTYHKYDDLLKCHYCGYSRPNYKKCPKCGSGYIRHFGGGTQKVQDELAKLFPSATMIRMDMDTTGKKQSYEKILQKFEKDKIDILIGTQMVAKGLDFENVTLVGVITADTMLNIDDYRSGERTFALLEQVSGRAGRGSKEGRAVIQTYTPEHEAISLVKTHNYAEFYNREIAKRRLTVYPPFCKIVSVHFSGSVESKVEKAAKFFLDAARKIGKVNQKIQVLGPLPSYISKIKNKYRWQIIFKCEDEDAFGKVLSQAEMRCRESKELSDVAIVIDKSPNVIN